MMFSKLFDEFVKSCPACVMHRALLEHVFSAEALDEVFRNHRQVQYERELLFSVMAETVSQVVCRISNSVRAAYIAKQRVEQIGVSLRSFYNKLCGIETCTSRAVVQHTARRVGDLIDRTKGQRRPLVKGYRTRILDGNHLGKTDHRLGVLRKTAAGALPGQSLVLLDYERMLIRDVFPCEDGHAQERSLLDQVLPVMESGDLLIDDRNFCTRAFLFGLKDRKACFVTRQHGRMPWQPVSQPKYMGRCSTGRVYQQQIELCHPESGKTTHIRRITVKLKTSTRDGDGEVYLLTNLPLRVTAAKVADVYRKRWTVEQAFNELTTHLSCELNTLGYPKAALFAFCVAACSYNMLAGIKGVMRGVHGEEVLDTQVSNYYLANEISQYYKGMMVAVPKEEWTVFQSMSANDFAAYLLRWAESMDLSAYPKAATRPKKPKKKRPNAQFQHVSTAKLLEQEKEKQKKRGKRRRPAASVT